MSSKSVLIVLDGFGIGKDSPWNAIANAQMPFYKELVAKYPSSQLITHGHAVGLPDGVMGNSEVGHMTMGAGRVLYQDLTRISKAIQDGEFSKNPEILATLKTASNARGRVQLMGLLSDGGVHSHIDHLKALLDLCLEQKIPQVGVHVFIDGRDTPPKSGAGYLRQLLTHPAFAAGVAKIVSVSGRYYAMDRDKRWERVQAAYEAICGQAPAAGCTALEAVEKSYLADKTDEFIPPTCIEPSWGVRNGDAIIFFNYRSDRAREISEAFTQSGFSGFVRKTEPKLSRYLCMTVYDKNLKLPVAFEPNNLKNIFADCLEQKGLKQLRIAETEKYAHVTFFFNGGREQPFKGEDRLLVPSPKDVPTYDLKPEMSALQVAAEASSRIAQSVYDFVLINFANADMVGHTGNYEAAVKAMETLDRCLSQVIGTAEKSGYHVLLTADHGNAEEMRDCNHEIHTQHTLNPVPAIWVAPGTALAPKRDRVALKDGTLADVMPTLCKLMNIPIPSEVSGTPLC